MAGSNSSHTLEKEGRQSYRKCKSTSMSAPVSLCRVCGVDVNMHGRHLPDQQQRYSNLLALPPRSIYVHLALLQKQAAVLRI